MISSSKAEVAHGDMVPAHTAYNNGQSLWQRVQNCIHIDFADLEAKATPAPRHWDLMRKWVRQAAQSSARLICPNRGAVGKLLVLVPTLNNRRALLPLLAKIQIPVWIAGSKSIQERNEALDLMHGSVTALFMIPWAVLQARKVRRSRAGLTHVPFVALVAMIAQAAGSIIYWRNYFSRVPVRGLLVANDHSPVSRCVSEAANALRVPSIYVQHANVSLDFPPPTAYDLMLLDGASAVKTYEALGNLSGNLVPIGAFRLRRSARRGAINNPPYAIGVAISALVPLQVLELFIERLMQDSRVQRVLIRTHPAQSVNEIRSAFESGHPGVEINPGSECLYSSFLDKIDIVIAGNSCVVHDALAYGVPAFYAPLDTARPDYYGFRATKCIRDWDDSILSESPVSLRRRVAESLRALEVHDMLAGKSMPDVEDCLLNAAALLVSTLRP